MTDNARFKVSRYNHFTFDGEGKIIAFNAMSRFLGKLDKRDYDTYQKLAVEHASNRNCASTSLIEKLKQGGFLIPETMDEIKQLRTQHYISRFGNRGLALTIIPTLNCNFSCDYCYQQRNASVESHSKCAVMKQGVQDGLVKLVLRRLEPDSTLVVTWFGGEPLLSLGVMGSLTEKFAEVCKAKGANYNAGIVTNGYLLDRKAAEKLIELNISFVQVTLDGSKEVHDRRRPTIEGLSSYQTIISNLKNLSNDSRISILIRINIDQRNSDNIPTLLNELRANNLHRGKNVNVAFHRVIADNQVCEKTQQDCISTYDFASLDLALWKAAATLGFEVRNYPTPVFSYCGATSKNSFIIDPSGNLYLCCATVGREELSVGKLSDSDLKLNDNYYEWMSYSPFDRKECIECSVLPICMGGCPYRSLYRSKFAEQLGCSCSVSAYNMEDRLKFYVESHRMGLLRPSRLSQDGRSTPPKTGEE